MSENKKYNIYKREYNVWDETRGFLDKIDSVKIDYFCVLATPHDPKNHNLITPEPVSYKEAQAIIRILPKERK